MLIVYVYMSALRTISYFSTKTYVVGTQKNHLNKTILLSTQNICSNCQVRKYLQFNIISEGAQWLSGRVLDLPVNWAFSELFFHPPNPKSKKKIPV